jgi:DNA-binding CsgD family transcriptional regulator
MLQLDTKERELNLNVLSIAQKNELLSNLSRDLSAAARSSEPERLKQLKDVLRKIDMHRRTGEDWRNFNEQLADVHDVFIRTLTSKHPTLTAKEVQLASLLKLNLSSKEISDVLSVGVASVEVYRSNLRKKLSLEGGTSLTTYIQSL